MRMILPAAATLLLSGAALAGERPEAAVFPFVKGRYWLYDGTVRFADGGEVREKKIAAWRSEVMDTVEGKDFKAALLKGGPADLTWYQEGKERGDGVVVLTSKGEFHEVRGAEDIVDRFAAIKSTGVLPDGFIGHETILFKFPPKTGDRFGDPEQTALGPRYCWVVLDASSAKPEPAVKGVPAQDERLTITLSYRTGPDHTNLRFVAGIGITSFEYVHHGTKGDCEMQLLETGP